MRTTSSRSRTMAGVVVSVICSGGSGMGIPSGVVDNTAVQVVAQTLGLVDLILVLLLILVEFGRVLVDQIDVALEDRGDFVWRLSSKRPLERLTGLLPCPLEGGLEV